MKTSFANADQENVPTASAEVTSSPAPTTPVNDTTALAPRPSAQMVSDNFFSNDGIEGDFDQSDIKMPRLSLVQSVGPLSGELGFTPGTFVYNKETVVGDPIKNPQGAVIGTENLLVTLFGLRKYFLEDIPYGTSDVFPKFFRTLDDARKEGFLPIQDKRQMGEDHKYVVPVLDADLLIVGKPEFASFPLDFNGTPYAAARWTLKSTAFSRVGKQFITDSQLALRNCGLLGKYYMVSAKRELLGKNWVFVPKATLRGVNTPEFIAWAKNMTGKKQAAA